MHKIYLKMGKAGKAVMAAITVLGLISSLITIKDAIDKSQDTQPPTTPMESFSGDGTAQTSSEEQGDNPISTVKCELPEMSESGYIEYLNSVIGSESCIVFCHYNDFNDDGDCEMFALVTTQEEKNRAKYNYENEIFFYEEGITGEIWFVNQDGARKVGQEMAYWNVSGPFQVGDRKFLQCEQYLTTGSITHLWGVNEKGKPYQPNISGKGYGLSINNYEIELTCSTYDWYYDADMGFLIGHTWKPYYFYWGGTNFKEYGGKLISIDAVYSINGSKELLEQFYSELRDTYNYNDIQIKEVYYRENGIININYQCRENSSDNDYYNHAAVIRYIGGELKAIPGQFGLCQEGAYRFALIPSVATPPDSSFESLFG